MKMGIIAAVGLSLIVPLSALAAARPEARVTAKNGPVQITFQLHKTKVKVKKSLWYKLELKNIGKRKIKIDDWTFKDPWAMHKNCKTDVGMYLEVINPDGTRKNVRSGGGDVTWDYAPKPGESKPLDPNDDRELNALREKWKRSGLTEQQQHIALDDWTQKRNTRDELKELRDPAKQFWLAPGASTMTFAWAYRDPSEFADHSKDEPQVDDYTQLWSYYFHKPGKYKIRAVYDYLGVRKMVTDDGRIPKEWWVLAETPFVDFEVLP